MKRLSKIQIWFKITELFLFLILFFQLTTERVEATKFNRGHFQIGDIVYPLMKTVEARSTKFFRIIGFSGWYVSDYKNYFNSINLQGKHLVSDIYFEPSGYQKINIFLGSDYLAGKYEQKIINATWLQFAISFEHWFSDKFAIKPGYIYRSSIDPLYEIIPAKTPSNGLSLATIYRPLNSTFVSTSFQILKSSSIPIFSDYNISGEVIQYLRDHDWCIIRGYFNSSSIFKSRSAMGIFFYNFQFPKRLENFCYKVGIGIGRDIYESGTRVNNSFLCNEVKYNLTDKLSLAFYYERRMSVYIKNQFGVHFQYCFLRAE